MAKRTYIAADAKQGAEVSTGAVEESP